MAVSGVVAAVGLVEECMVCLGQQHFGRKEQAAVVFSDLVHIILVSFA